MKEARDDFHPSDFKKSEITIKKWRYNLECFRWTVIGIGLGYLLHSL
jgi:hypothetical protein